MCGCVAVRRCIGVILSVYVNKSSYVSFLCVYICVFLCVFVFVYVGMNIYVTVCV